MSGNTGFLDADALRAATFVRHVELHDTLPSTNDRAIQLAASPDLETPALIVAHLQTAGRGRGQRTWWSADGALTFSLILDTDGWGLTQRDWPRLSLTTAVAVCDAIEAGSRERGAGSEEIGLAPCSPLPAPCLIKWPNDVLIDGRKVCGILVESPGGAAPSKNRLIIGVGINVNNSWRDAPRDVGTTGIALYDVTGKFHNLQSILIDFLTTLERRLKQINSKDPAVPHHWQQLCWLTGEDVAITTDGPPIEGRCIGIADDGALLIKTVHTTKLAYSGSVCVISQ